MYKIIEQNGKKFRPLTVKAAQDLFAENRELVYELIPGSMTILANLSLARDHMAPHEGGRYYTPIDEDVYGDYSEKASHLPELRTRCVLCTSDSENGRSCWFRRRVVGKR